jgi:hypothetical protein|tara:strand:+ start:1314 stop:1547 length:234 start_codon:yes stop_codon:yes gene_type:complete
MGTPRNISELTPQEVTDLCENTDYNCCDKCGDIEISWDLFWSGYDFMYKTKTLVSYDALCEKCYEQEKSRIKESESK